jgi:hypothetical protein
MLWTSTPILPTVVNSGCIHDTNRQLLALNDTETGSRRPFSAGCIAARNFRGGRSRAVCGALKGNNLKWAGCIKIHLLPNREFRGYVLHGPPPYNYKRIRCLVDFGHNPQPPSPHRHTHGGPPIGEKERTPSRARGGVHRTAPPRPPPIRTERGIWFGDAIYRPASKG